MRDVQALAETVLVGIDSTDFGSGEKERRSAARAALDELVLVLTRQEEALEFYADRDNYRRRIRTVGFEEPAITMDNGVRARVALSSPPVTEGAG